jgi:hypothetical protein
MPIKSRPVSRPQKIVLPLPIKPDVKAALSKQELENPEWLAHLVAMKDKWSFVGGRFEAILRSNLRKLHPEKSAATEGGNKQQGQPELPPVYLVGEGLTYADVLVAHITTWFVEECGSDIMKEMPLLVNLQHAVIGLPGIRNYLKSINYFPVGNAAYVDQVRLLSSLEFSIDSFSFPFDFCAGPQGFKSQYLVVLVF